MIFFISGGARSGKSQFAEQTALSIFYKMQKENHKTNLFYMATAKRSDDEMAERIRIHQQDRGKKWQTVEEPFQLELFHSKCKIDDVILIDCLTIWLSNVMFELGHSIDKIENNVKEWLSLSRKNKFHLVIVSNDVNEGIPSTEEIVLRYVYTLQRLHQLVVQQSDIAVQVHAGIPMVWKGDIQ